MSLNKQILELANEYENYIIDCRRKVHTFAEIGMHEFKTKAFIIEEAGKLGLSYEEVPTTSVIVKLDTGRPGKHIALRADIDALPMEESPTNLVGTRTCVSEHPKTCHACGHDGHTAMLLGAMQMLYRLKDSLNGVIYFCFEEGEEPNSGIDAILAALDKYAIDRVWGIHVYAALEEGKISVHGPRMAGYCTARVDFIGKAGHASRPDLAINPLFCSANFLNNLCVAFCNQITAGETVTMAIPMMHVGNESNMIDSKAEIKGTFRFFNNEEGKKAQKLFRTVAEHTAAMHKCRAEFPLETINSAVINDEESSRVAERVLSEILPEGSVVQFDPWYAGETFSKWLEKYKGVLAFLGIKNEEAGYGAGHHNEKFDFNESVMKTGAISTVRYAVEWLRNDI
ncbi:amidohydrolase [Clostridium sp. BSD9I1]|uniref:amidohydrolase n=1 Tax=Clostridium sp. BSD9I1 TaxID=2003589 RepID=UPI0016487E54|nr:amidohydrolase [Clostridium sp. BSD9I1]